LGLDGKSRVKAEKCLADAIYFESRGEAERGQMAVAQVVMNRVFSGFYPDNVCGVVYQNAHRHLACQFTFACEGKRLTVEEPDMWEQAKRISRDTLDGKLWLPEVGKSTHYHAYWVRPSWIHEMKRNWKFGVHTFYRPRAWGDGSDEPAWGSGAKLVSAPEKSAAATPPSVGAAKM
jgi:spore germination cell wall hydrolase CwlJ-like protein